MDPLATSRVLAKEARSALDGNALEIVDKTADAISAIQVKKEMSESSFLSSSLAFNADPDCAGAKMSSGVTSSEDVPAFPQTSLLKLAKFLAIFPPPPHASLSMPEELATVLLAFHPALSYIAPDLWRQLETALEGAGLGEWVAGLAECDPSLAGSHGSGFMGFSLASVERASDTTATLTFSRGGVDSVSVVVGAGPRPFLPYPLTDSSLPAVHLTPRFLHTLTSLFQLHAVKDFDISILPPSSSLQSSSSSTTLIIETFAQLLGYEVETVHLVKDLGGGREMWMRRVVETGIGAGTTKGVTSWEPSPMTIGAWEGKLVHLEGIDAIGEPFRTSMRHHHGATR